MRKSQTSKKLRQRTLQSAQSLMRSLITRKSKKLLTMPAKQEKVRYLHTTSLTICQKEQLLDKERLRKMRKLRKKPSVAQKLETMSRLRSVTWVMDAGLITISLPKFKLDSTGLLRSLQAPTTTPQPISGALLALSLRWSPVTSSSSLAKVRTTIRTMITWLK